MLTKAIYYGKEKRKEYRRAARYVRSCRNHGSCAYCMGNRLYNTRKLELEAKDKMKERESLNESDSLSYVCLD